MGKLRILLVDQDEAYLMPLERMLIEKLGEQLELMVITDSDYLIQFFQEPRQLDLLIIHEELYNGDFQKHSIRNIFFLSEEESGAEATEELHKVKLYKYTSVTDLYRKIIGKAKLELSDAAGRDHGLRVIAVYSPIGGSGKTTVAMGLSQALANNGKQVLFMGTDSLQTFGMFLGEPIFFSSKVEKQMTARSSYIYSELRQSIIHQGFDLLPAFPKVQPSFGIEAEHYTSLIGHIKEAGEYQFLILDLATDFSKMTMSLLGLSDNIVLLLASGKHATHKMERLLDNMDCSDENKFTCICNKTKKDHVLPEEIRNQCNIQTFIPHDPAIETMEVEELAKLAAIQEVAILFI